MMKYFFNTPTLAAEKWRETQLNEMVSRDSSDGWEEPVTIQSKQRQKINKTYKYRLIEKKGKNALLKKTKKKRKCLKTDNGESQSNKIHDTYMDPETLPSPSLTMSSPALCKFYTREEEKK